MKKPAQSDERRSNKINSSSTQSNATKQAYKIIYSIINPSHGRNSGISQKMIIKEVARNVNGQNKHIPIPFQTAKQHKDCMQQ